MFRKVEGKACSISHCLLCPSTPKMGIKNRCAGNYFGKVGIGKFCPSSSFLFLFIHFLKFDFFFLVFQQSFVGKYANLGDGGLSLWGYAPSPPRLPPKIHWANPT